MEKTLESPLDCKEIQPVHPGWSVLNVHCKDWCWSWNANTLATWCKELTQLKRPWCWEWLKAGGEEDNRGWNGWVASSTQWTCLSKLQELVMDREVWWVAVHRVEKSQVRLRMSYWTELRLNILIVTWVEMVLRGTEANRTACAMHSNPHPGSPSHHYHPIIFRESPYWCSFCSLFLYLSVSTALRKSDADWGQLKMPPPEGSMELCTPRSAPEVMGTTPSLCQSRQTKLVLGKSGAGLHCC